MSEFSDQDDPFVPELEDWIRDAGALPSVGLDLRERVVGAAVRKRRRRVLVARVQAVAVAVCLFVATAVVGGHYLSMWFGSSLMDRGLVADGRDANDSSPQKQLSEAWEKADEWAVVEASLALKTHRTQMLRASTQ